MVCLHKKTLREIGLESFWMKDKIEDEENWTEIVRKHIHEREEKEWREECLKSRKLRTYVKLKTKLEKEKYLLSRDRYGKPEFTKIRGGTNRLMIEKGRYQKIPLEQRLCVFCDK